MANVYVWSGATGAGNGSSWADAYTTLASAATNTIAVGDDVWIASDHLENNASGVSISLPFVSAAPVRIFSVNRAGSVPPVAADLLPGATITSTGTFTFNTGQFYMYGVNITAGVGSTGIANINSVSGLEIFEKCVFTLATTNTSARISLSGGGAAFIKCIDCNFVFGNIGQGFGSINGKFQIIRSNGTTLVTGSSIPSNLFQSTSLGKTIISGADLSNFTSKAIWSPSQMGLIQLINCKLPASPTLNTLTNLQAEGIEIIASHSTNNAKRNEMYQFSGTLTTETTVTRSGGASDGTLSYSWKVVTTSNNKRQAPFIAFNGTLWNTSTGSSKTLSVHCLTDITTLDNSDIWLEVEYLGDSTVPQSSFISSAPATLLTNGTGLSNDLSESWTTTGLSLPFKQKFSVTFTPQMEGPIRWKVKVAKASTTVYICPKVELS